MEPFFACLLILMAACVSDRLPGGNPAPVHYSGPFRWVGSSWSTGFAPCAQLHLFPAASSKPPEQQWCVLQPHGVWGEVTRFSYKYDSNHTNVQTPEEASRWYSHSVIGFCCCFIFLSFFSFLSPLIFYIPAISELHLTFFLVDSSGNIPRNTKRI